MRSLRTTESIALGYRIERVEQYGKDGALHAVHHEVLSPQTDVVMASLPSLRAAQRFIVAHELRSARLAQPQLAA